MTVPTLPQSETDLPAAMGQPWVVTRRMAMAFAAGLLLDHDRLYDTAEREGDILPFLCARFEWPLSLALRPQLGLASDQLIRGVHASQITRIHRPFRIGETVRCDAVVDALHPSRAGLVMTATMTTRAIATGEAITASHSTVIYRNVAAPPGLRLTEPRQSDDLADLGSGTGIRVELSNPALAHAYTEGADIFNPIHTERHVAAAAGLGDILVHGTAIWAKAGWAIAQTFCDCDITRIRNLVGAKFTAPVRPRRAIAMVIDPPNAQGRVRWTVIDTESATPLLIGGSQIG